MASEVKDILEKANSLLKEGFVADAIELLSGSILVNSNSVDLLKSRAEAYVLNQKLSLAINDYRKVVELKPEDLIAKTRLHFIEQLLAIGRNDIYANTNTNLDPWLD